MTQQFCLLSAMIWNKNNMMICDSVTIFFNRNHIKRLLNFVVDVFFFQLFILSSIKPYFSCEIYHI